MVLSASASLAAPSGPSWLMPRYTVATSYLASAAASASTCSARSILYFRSTFPRTQFSGLHWASTRQLPKNEIILSSIPLTFGRPASGLAKSPPLGIAFGLPTVTFGYCSSVPSFLMA